MANVVLVQSEPRGPSQLVEIPVNSAGLQRVYIPDIQQLRSTTSVKVVIKQIRLITADVLTAGITTGFTTAPVTELKKLALVIYCNGWEKGQYIPILTLNDVGNPAGAIPQAYQPAIFDNWVDVDWSKSYLQYANGTVSAGAPYAVLLDVLYQKFSSDGSVIVGPS